MKKFMVLIILFNILTATGYAGYTVHQWFPVQRQIHGEKEYVRAVAKIGDNRFIAVRERIKPTKKDKPPIRRVVLEILKQSGQRILASPPIRLNPQNIPSGLQKLFYAYVFDPASNTCAYGLLYAEGKILYCLRYDLTLSGQFPLSESIDDLWGQIIHDPNGRPMLAIYSVSKTKGVTIRLFSPQTSHFTRKMSFTWPQIKRAIKQYTTLPLKGDSFSALPFYCVKCEIGPGFIVTSAGKTHQSDGSFEGSIEFFGVLVNNETGDLEPYYMPFRYSVTLQPTHDAFQVAKQTLQYAGDPDKRSPLPPCMLDNFYIMKVRGQRGYQLITILECQKDEIVTIHRVASEVRELLRFHSHALDEHIDLRFLQFLGFDPEGMLYFSGVGRHRFKDEPDHFFMITVRP